MLKYGELNLKEIREKANLDFAHFTYNPSQCSCCYSPKDMPSIYWKNRIIPEDNDYSFILFKNANNGSGVVTKNDYICESAGSRETRKHKKERPWIVHEITYRKVFVEYGGLSEEQMDIVISELQSQLGEEYQVIKPKYSSDCIIIIHKDHKEY